MPETISNQYDGPRPPSKRMTAQFSLDYAGSDDPEELDQGIRETIQGVRLSILALGIGLAKIKAKGLYIDLQYHSMNDYIESLCDDMNVERSTAHNWLYMGEAWIKYRKDLEKVGFSEEDGPTKLPYVDRALEVYQKKDVFRAIKEMSLRQFITFSKGEEPAARETSVVKVKGNQVYIGNRLAVTLDGGLDRRTRSQLETAVVEAGKALEAGEVLYTTRLYDGDELRRFGQAAERLKKDLRGKR